jgi:hypothetical protein
MCLFWQINGLGYILGDFFKTSSGHPVDKMNSLKTELIGAHDEQSSSICDRHRQGDQMRL